MLQLFPELGSNVDATSKVEHRRVTLELFVEIEMITELLIEGLVGMDSNPELAAERVNLRLVFLLTVRTTHPLPVLIVLLLQLEVLG